MDRGDIVSLAAMAAIIASLVGFLGWLFNDAERAPTGIANLYRELRALGLPPIVAGPVTVLLTLF